MKRSAHPMLGLDGFRAAFMQAAVRAVHWKVSHGEIVRHSEILTPPFSKRLRQGGP
jgi:hypothetical protein